MLLSGLTVVLGILAFVAIADEMAGGDTQKFDDWAIRTLRDPDYGRPVGPTWLEEIGRDLTALGGVAVLFLVTARCGGLSADAAEVSRGGVRPCRHAEAVWC